MTSTRGRAAAAAAALASIALLATACSSDPQPTPTASPTPTVAVEPTTAPSIPDQQPTVATPSSPSSSVDPGGSADPTVPSGQSTATVPGLGKPKPEAIIVASRYLDIRENAESSTQKKPTSWLSQIKPTMTPKAYKALASGVEDDGATTYAWQEAHKKGLKVKTDVACGINEAGKGKNSTILLCTLNDQVVYNTGEPVSLNDVPDTWPYVGPQESPQLGMVFQGGKWYVDHDYTGEAS